jgi:Leucine-rich repeat (LRR) protein
MNYELLIMNYFLPFIRAYCFILFIFCLFSPTIHAQTCNRKTDSLALVELYKSTNGAQWTNKWDLNKPMTTWYGVTLGGGCVTELDMSSVVNNVAKGNNLKGSIPSVIGNLQNLQTLNLAANKLTGTIPAETGNLQNLQILDLATNELTDTISKSIENLKNLKNLKNLNFSQNKMTGVIPESIGNLTELTFLALTNNSLTGKIPARIDKLTKLTELHLTTNQLTGSIPHEIGKLSSLVRLCAQDNQLLGSIPSELGHLKKLTTICLYSNSLSDTLPPTLWDLTELTDLSIGNNDFMSDIPDAMLKLTKLRTFSIVGNKFTRLPNLNRIASLGQPYSEGVHVENNKLTFKDILPNKPLFDRLGKLGGYCCQDIIGSDTTITGTVGTPLTLDLAIDDTVTTNIYNWYKDGTLFRTIKSTSKLTIAPLSLNDAGTYTCKVTNSKVTDLTLQSRKTVVKIILPIQTCREPDSLALVELYKSTNGENWTNKWDLTKPMTKWYGVTLSSGCVTELRMWETVNNFPKGNNMSGLIPAVIGNLPNLQVLDLAANKLSGTIPKSIGKLTKLTDFSIWGNGNIEGTIPSEIGNLTNLTVLSIQNNKLSGGLEVLGKLKKLRIIWASFNKFEGKLPDTFWDLTELEALAVHYNQFSGDIPDAMLKLTKLETFKIDSNLFTRLPRLKNNLAKNKDLFVGTNRLTFKDILPNKSLFSTKEQYIEQELVGVDATLMKNVGDDLTINLSIDDTVTTNIYNWYKDGTLVKTIKGTSKLIIIPLSLKDAGTYTCKVTNPNVAGLTLQSRKTVVKIIIPIVIQTCRQPDSLSLTKLYNATDGANWKNKWNFTKPMTTWYGVKLTAGCVTELNLSGNNLSGSILSDIGNLQNLKVLNFANNKISVIAENSLWKLTNLEALNISNNNLTGEIPDAALNLKKLTTLNISYNQFIRIPKFTSISTFGKTSPQGLYVNNNQLTFKDILPNQPLFTTNTQYIGQDLVGTAATLIKNIDDALTLNVAIDDTVTTNTYTWYKDGIRIEPSNSINKWVIERVSLHHRGTYTCKVTNSKVTDLTLQSRNIVVQVIMPDDLDLAIGITPGAESNGVLEIPFLTAHATEYPDNELLIYNRWGDIVFHKIQYNNNWDGGELPQAVYYFILKMNNTTEKLLKIGRVVILK